MNPEPTEILATVLFALAVLHTFTVKRFAHWAHKYPNGSIQENLLHFLALRMDSHAQWEIREYVCQENNRDAADEQGRPSLDLGDPFEGLDD